MKLTNKKSIVKLEKAVTKLFRSEYVKQLRKEIYCVIDSIEYHPEDDYTVLTFRYGRECTADTNSSFCSTVTFSIPNITNKDYLAYYCLGNIDYKEIGD